MEPNQTNESNDKYTNYTYSAPDDSQTYSAPHTNPAYESNASQYAQQPYQNQQYQQPYQNQQYQQNPYGSAPNYSNPQYQPQYNYQPNQYQGEPASKGLSIAAMACGIASIVFACCYGMGLIPAIVALVLQGNFVKANNGNTNSMARAGKICGIIGLIFSILMILFFVIAITAGVLSEM